MKLIDNINHRLADDLKAEIKKGSKLSIAASSFSIYAFEALKKELSNISELQFIFTSPAFLEEKIKKKYHNSLFLTYLKKLTFVEVNLN